MTQRKLCIADASALHEMCRIVPTSRHTDLMEALTKRVDDKELGFPRKVCKELQLIATGQTAIWAWASALTSKLNPFKPDYFYMPSLMTFVADVGFEFGIEALEKGEDAFGDVCQLCLGFTDSGRDFVLATEDTGTFPLRPTMEQVAMHFGWDYLNARGALDHLGLAVLLS